MVACVEPVEANRNRAVVARAELDEDLVFLVALPGETGTQVRHANLCGTAIRERRDESFHRPGPNRAVGLVAQHLFPVVADVIPVHVEIVDEVAARRVRLRIPAIECVVLRHPFRSIIRRFAARPFDRRPVQIGPGDRLLTVLVVEKERH